MSKLYERYLTLKRQDPSTLYLFKSGIFYIFLDEDAKKMSMLLNLKLGNLNDSIVKCGFPINSLAKYSSLIQNSGYKLHIVDISSNSTHSSNEIILNSSIKNFIRKISIIDSNNMSIREAYEFIDNINKEAKQYVKEIKF